MDEPVVVGRVVSVNVGRPRIVEWNGRKVRTAIWKAPVEGPVGIQGFNVHGDEQADPRVHGGYDKAIYAYAIEDYQWWSEQLGDPVGAGTFGENLTTEGVELAAAVVGEQWRIGSTILEVSEPRTPCFKLGIRMGDMDFVDRFDDALRFGTYLRVVDDGDVTAGDAITRLRRPKHGVTIGELAIAPHHATPALLGRILAAAEVSPRWREKAEKSLQRQQAG